jgi:pyruvate/2-oxoacid:ferredoxin oxidoreductase alpha subunit
VAVLDRDLSPGLGGILWGEIRGCAAPGAVVQNYVIGLGGGDIRPEQIERILDQAAQLERAAEPQFVEVG